MESRFFKPFVGPKYDEGICGKKILVLGASFYCDKNGQKGKRNCPFFAECTDPVKKDSSKFDTTCSEYAKQGRKISDEPRYAMETGYDAYIKFAEFMQQFVSNQSEDVWDRMAFTDYVQFFLPTWKTKKEYLSERDFDAFIETLQELNPDVVISWGTAIVEEIREKNPYVIDKDKLPETDWYVCHMNVPNVQHEITLVSCYHPKSRGNYWDDNIGDFAKHLHSVLK